MKLYSLLLFSFLIAGTTALFIPLQNRIDGFMETFQERTLASLEERFGYSVSYERIRPTILVSLEIFNVRLGGDEDPLLDMRRLLVRYNLLKLLRGDIESAVREVVIINAALTVDAERDSRLFPPSGSGAGGPFRLPSVPGLTITGKNIALNYRGEGFSLSLDDFFFSLQGGEVPRTEGRGRLALAMAGEETGVAAVEWTTGVQLSGSWSGPDTASVVLALRNLDAPFFSLPAVRLQADYSGTAVRVTKIADKVPLDITLTHDLSQKVTGLELLMEDFVPASFLGLSGEAAGLAPWLRNSVSGSFRAGYAHDAGTLSYDGELSARIVSVSGVDLPFPSDHRVELRVSGDAESVKVGRMRVTSSGMDVTLSGAVDISPFAASADFRIDRFDAAGGSVGGRGRLTTDGTVFRLSSGVLSYNDILLDEVEAAAVNNRDGSADYSLSVYFNQPEAGERGYLFSEGALGYGDGFFLDSSVKAYSLPLSRFFPELRRRGVAVPALPDLFLDASLFFSTDGERLSYSVGQAAVRDALAENFFRLSAAGTLEEHEISSFRGVLGDYRLQGDAGLSLETDALLLSGDFSLNGVDFGFTSYYDFGKSVVVSGDYGTRITARLLDDGLYFAAETASFPVPFPGETPPELSFSLHGTYSSTSSWQVVLDDLSAAGMLPFPKENPRPASIETRGMISSGSIHLSEIAYDDGTAPLYGTFGAWYPENYPLESEGWLSLADQEGAERYLAAFDLGKEGLFADLSLSGVPTVRLGLEDSSGTFEGSAAISGPYTDPDFAAELKLLDGEVKDKPLEIELTARKKERNIVLEYGRGRYGNHILQKLSGSFDMEAGEARLEGEYLPFFQTFLNSAGFTIEGSTIPVDSILEIASIAGAPFDIKIGLDSIVTPAGEKDAQRYTVMREKETISVSGGPGDSVAGYYNIGGDFRLSLSGPLPVIASMSGVITDGVIASDLSVTSADLSLLEGVADIGFFALSGGTATGSLKIRGALNDPSFSGSFSLLDAQASSSLFPDGLSLFDAFIRIDDRKISLIAEPISSGSASLDASVELTLERWLPRTFRIAIRPEGEEGVKTIYSIPRGGVDVTGFTRGTFIIEGSPGLLKLSGDLRVTDAEIALQNRQEGRRGDRRTAPRRKNDFILDLSITSGRKVEFFWPSVNFPILRSFAATEQEVDISFNSSEQSFALQGDIGIQGGEISYLQRNFLITRGSITFNETADRFDPRLTVEAVLREMDENGEPLKIFLTVNNQPLSRFEPRFSSEPAMSDAEIIAILGAALPTRIGQEAIDLTTGLALTGSLVSQLGIIGSFESRVKEVLQVDLFSIRTQMIQNLILDRVGSALNNEEFAGADFSQYLDNTTIFLGKYFGNDLFIQGTLQIQANQITEQIVRQNDLFIDSEISLEWKTPLFLLELAIQPDFENPLESINNTSLGFSWGFSY